MARYDNARLSGCFCQVNNHAAEDIEALLSEVERLQKELDERVQYHVRQELRNALVANAIDDAEASGDSAAHRVRRNRRFPFPVGKVVGDSWRDGAWYCLWFTDGSRINFLAQSVVTVDGNGGKHEATV